jgi:hypothetical protein
MRLRDRAWAALWALVLLAAARRAGRRPRTSQRLYWGPEPLVNVKYISDALREAGHDSTSVVSHDYENFRGVRFDRYHAEIVAASGLPSWVRERAPLYIVGLHVFRTYDVVHIPFTGGPLGKTPLAWLEPHLFRRAGIRTVMLPYGGDFMRYSWTAETLMRHAMLINYPDAGRREDIVDRRVKRWMRHADIVVGGFLVEGASRWDVLTTNYLIVPPDRVPARTDWTPGDGERRPIKIVHAPNHRGVKGTEFIIEAVAALERKGYAIDFVLLEGTANETVLEEMRSADICIDHCIGSGFGLFAIEAMASGATVMANLEDEQRIGVHRHFGWLNQCPIVSANIEQLEETLEHLVRSPDLRVELGRLGTEYVRRYHSPQMAQHLFGAIYRKLAGEDVDLLMLFHPMHSEYLRSFEPLRPPLRRNRPL